MVDAIQKLDPFSPERWLELLTLHEMSGGTDMHVSFDGAMDLLPMQVLRDNDAYCELWLRCRFHQNGVCECAKRIIFKFMSAHWREKSVLLPC